MRISSSIALVLIASGCAASARFSVGPTIDTHGVVGVEARVSGSFGPGDEQGGVVAGSYVGGGGDQSADGSFSAGVLLGVTGVPGHLELMLGGRGSRYSNFVGGLELGIGYPIVDDVRRGNWLFGTSRTAWILGVAVRFEGLIGDDARALVAFPLYLELYKGM